MAIKQFIKDNLALVAGIAVPVLLVGGFLLTSQLGRAFTDPPRHIAYFVLENYDQKNEASIDIQVGKDGRIIATIVPVKADDNGYRPGARTEVLLAFDAAANKITEISITIPEGQGKRAYVPNEFKNLRLNTSRTAPDGYEVVYDHDHGGLVFQVLVNGAAEGYRIRKGASIYRLPNTVTGMTSRYYNSNQNPARFLGWSEQATP